MSIRANRDPLFNLASYARRGPGERLHLTPAEIQQIERTVNRTPEVMVKVLSRGAADVRAVARHFDYIGRRGEVDIETDEGRSLQGEDAGQKLAEDWDLEVDQYRSRADLAARPRQKPPRLVHKLILSMPAGTPPKKVLTAVQNFAREEFGAQHRYAMALHTDEPHPHVHLVVKAISERGERLNIRNVTRRKWRARFAEELRALGVAANATERQVRGQDRTTKRDGIYRAALRGDSKFVRQRVEAVARDMTTQRRVTAPGRTKLLATRVEVERGWRQVSELLEKQGKLDLAARVNEFVADMKSAKTDQEQIAGALMETWINGKRSAPERDRTR